MARERPINAGVPAGESAAKPAKRRKPASWLPGRSIPLPLKLVGGAIVLVAVFIVAAILGGEDEQAGVVIGGRSKGAAELGYPATATKNTTRIAGGDPAADAAGAALAVFPSTEPGQRPAAVTLVDEGDWAGALAASVLMAAPVRAPILFSSPAGMPEVSSEALAALDPQGSGATGGASLFAIGEEVAVPGGSVTQVKGSGAAAIAVAIAKLRERLAGTAPRHVVIAPAAKPDFAMPAAAWAARSGDPILYTGAKRLAKPTAAFLRRHPKVPAYVLGPSTAIPSDVVRQIARIGPQVRRVSGEEPVENAIALARYHDGDFGWNVNDPGHGFVVARSDQPLDAAAAAPLSASGTWGPLLLTDDAGTLPAALRGYLLDVKPGYTDDPTRAFYNHVWVIGDQEAIEVGQQAEIDSLAELAKIGGKE